MVKRDFHLIYIPGGGRASATHRKERQEERQPLVLSFAVLCAVMCYMLLCAVM